VAETTIEWTDRVWNPVRGCALVSAGCTNCYAMKQAHRFSGKGKPYEGLTKMTSHGPTWTGRARIVPEMLNVPLLWRKPSRIFVNSMSDLMHEDVPDEFIAEVFAIMARCQQHTFQLLTKRPERLHAFCNAETRWWDIASKHYGKPLPNVWLGVSVEDQATADERIPLLLDTPAAIRFLSCEPLLAPIDFSPDFGNYDARDYLRGLLRYGEPGDAAGAGAGIVTEQGNKINWVIIGGESGSAARRFDVEWARSVIRQCREARVPAFYKQGGASNACPHDRAGGHIDCFPDDLKIREFPNA